MKEIPALRNFKVLTLTHRQINMSDMASYVIPNNDDQSISSNLNRLKKHFEIEEILYLSTCNRVMFLLSKTGSFSKADIPRFFLLVNPNISEEEIQFATEKSVILEGAEAVRHILEVASSIDSMVIGEREILRQLRTAYNSCLKYGTTGDDLRLLMKVTVATAKAVHSQTKIGQRPLSIVSLAMQSLKLKNLPSDSRILLIGAGETMNRVGKFLLKGGFNNVCVFNRSIGNAQKLANVIGGQAFELDNLAGYSVGFDVIIACTSSGKIIIDHEMFNNLDHNVNERKLLIDLAIPNNIDPALSKLDTVNYLQIDDLKILAKENLAFRSNEIKKVALIINGQLEKFKSLYNRRKIERLLNGVPDKIKEARVRATEEVFKKELEQLNENEKELLTRMMDYMEKKCVSIPMSMAKGIVDS